MGESKMDRVVASLNKAITKAGGGVNNRIIAEALKSLQWHLRPPYGWRPLTTAPEDERVLVSDGESVDIAFLRNGQWYGYVSIPFVEKITHWMPLPKPPEVTP